MTISSTTAVSPLSSTSAVHKVGSATDSSSRSAIAEPSSAGDQTKLSKLGALMSKLQDLESSDTAKAKQVLTSIASALTEKANAAGSSDPHLQELADKFTEAAKTGDLSGLSPKGREHHHRHEGPPPSPPSSSPASSDATTAAAAATTASRKTESYTHSESSLAQLESVIGDALSGAST
jgi:uncharacterized coiled-coil protein SlyX